MKWPSRNKYGVSAKIERTYKGVLYASKAEACRAFELDILVRSGEIERWERQVKFQLGEDFTYRADFVLHHTSTRYHVEDIKGIETERFRMTKRLWLKYGPAPLVIMTRVGTGRWRKVLLNGGMDGNANADKTLV